MASKPSVFDFETDGLEAGTDKCNPVELAACAIHTRYLTPIKDSEFSILARRNKSQHYTSLKMIKTNVERRK